MLTLVVAGHNKNILLMGGKTDVCHPVSNQQLRILREQCKISSLNCYQVSWLACSWSDVSDDKILQHKCFIGYRRRYEIRINSGAHGIYPGGRITQSGRHLEFHFA